MLHLLISEKYLKVLDIPSTPKNDVTATKANNISLQSELHIQSSLVDKYIVGVNLDVSEKSILKERYYIHQSMVKDYGWKVLEISKNGSTREMLNANPPRVIVFHEKRIRLARFLDTPYLKSKGTIIAIQSDDVQFYSKEFRTDEMLTILKLTDVVLGTYAYRFRDYFSNIGLPEDQMPRWIWIPHSASPPFTSLNFNEDPERKMFLSGHISEAYPLRLWFRKKYLPDHRDEIIHYEYPKQQGHLPINQSDVYASNIHRCFCGFTSTSLFRYAVAKTFEIPATGALLLVNDNLEPEFRALGMINMQHYVAYDSNDPSKMLNWTINPKNFDKVDEIRKRGMTLIRDRHKTSDRVKAIDDFFELGIESYPFDYRSFRDSPCPMQPFPDYETCNATYKGYTAFFYGKEIRK